MAETITGVPNLGTEPSVGALKLSRMNGGATGELIERIAWTLDPEAFQIWEREYLAAWKVGGPTHTQLSVRGRREAARKTATAIVDGPLAQAVAAAREEGRAAGLNEAADWLKPTWALPCDCERCDCGNSGNTAAVAAWHAENDASEGIRALIPTKPQTGTASPAEGGRDDG